MAEGVERAGPGYVVHDWGRRLSDQIRSALEAGEPERARRLALEGDGKARSLAKEYALMLRGLGITLRALLDLLPKTLERLDHPERAGADLIALLARLRTDLRALAPASDDDAGGPTHLVGDALEQTRRALAAAEVHAACEQERLAAEVVAALEGGDAAAARHVLDLKEHDRWVPLHDRMIRFMAELFAWVLRHGGSRTLLWFHRATAEAQRPGFERWERLAAADFARATAFLLKQHMGELTVTEDGEKFTVEQVLCGSGGRLRVSGAYEGPAALPFVEEPGPLTLGEPRMPVYCTHCPVWNGLAPLEWFGRPHWVFDRPARPDGSCTLHIYKRRDGAPRAYAQRLGWSPAGFEGRSLRVGAPAPDNRRGVEDPI